MQQVVVKVVAGAQLKITYTVYRLSARATPVYAVSGCRDNLQEARAADSAQVAPV